MKVNGARVNPYALLDLPFPKNPAADFPIAAAPASSVQPEATPAAVGGDMR
jgi:hypothetical protein